mgnify:CR=1 FL=1
MSALKRLPVRLILGVIIFLAVFFLTSCSSSPAENPASPSDQSAANASAAQTVPTATLTTEAPTQTPVALAARVNGQPIPLEALDREVNRRLQGIRSIGDPAPADMDAFRMGLLDALIDQTLIEQAAAAQGVSVSDAEVQAELDVTVQIAGNRENLQAQLAADGMTEAEYREGLRAALLTQRMRDRVTESICVTVEQVQARHILVADEATAQQIRAQLDAGADFGALAAQFSLDVTTRQAGGDLGWFARGQLLQAAVEVTAFALAEGEISAPVRSELGYHIIQTNARAQDRPLEDENCYLLVETAFERWIQDLRTNAQIERFPNG